MESNNNIIVLLIGCPSSGKTSTASEIKSPKVSHQSVGKEFRRLVADNEPLGKEIKGFTDSGKIVPLHITEQVVDMFLRQGKEILIIDGFPRDMEQLKMFETIRAKSKYTKLQVIEVMVDKKTALNRIADRNRGVDDDIKKFDDRMNVYNKDISEIRDYYKSRGMYSTLDGSLEFRKAVEKLSSAIFAL